MRLSIRKKLLIVVAVTTGLTLFAALGMMLVNKVDLLKSMFEQRLNMQAHIMAEHLAPSLNSGDSEAIENILSAIHYDETVYLVQIVNNEGGLIFQHNTSSNFSIEDPQVIEELVADNVHATAIQDIEFYGRKVGELVIFSSNEQMKQELLQRILLAGLIVCIALLIVVAVSYRMLKKIYVPFEYLLGTVRQISAEKNYHLRARVLGDDEVSQLADTFNEMLAQIQDRDEKLEAKVAERTQQLLAKNKDLERSEKRFKTAFDNTSSGFMLFNSQGRILQVNPALCNMLNYTEQQFLDMHLVDIMFEEDWELFLKEFVKLRRGEVANFNLQSRYLSAYKSVLWGQVDIAAVRDEDDKDFAYAVAQLQNITESYLLAEQLTYQACHDPLTELINRREFERRLVLLINRAKSESSEHALMYIDLDQFKVVNDTCGHVAGDELLKQLSHIMQDHIRQSDTLARLGGDEFGVLIESCSLEDSLRLANKIRESIEESRFVWEDKHFALGISIGVIPIDAQSGDSTELLKAADAACYAAKDAGRNHVHLYHGDDLSLAQRQGEMQWVSRITQALETNRFVLYAQPIQHISTENISHHEVLIRMLDEEGKLIPPGAFLPAAERYNLIARLDKWVIEAAFDFISNIPPAQLDGIGLSINLSGNNIGSSSFLDYVSDKLDELEIPNSQICFEITETAAVSNLGKAREFVVALKKKGCLFSLDDFGSGVSSFAYLKSFPVDFLKIDGVFIKELLEDPIDRAMVKSINEISHVMGKRTIAEFVENQQVVTLLHEMGVDFAQGYGIGQPVPIEQILKSE
jgi:diguanylate cyclase (GGDEF)-like protein/PAS domain S-box-containing protein